jgi:hypothetical protein
VSEGRDGRPGAGPSYGRLVGRLYDYFFGSTYTGQRLNVRKAVEAFGRREGGALLDDGYTELFPKVRFESRSHEGRLVITPAYSGLHEFDLTASFTARHPALENFPFPVVQIFSSNLLKRIFSDPTLRRLRTGDPTFDHWFLTRSLDSFPVGDFLGPEGKRVLFALRYLFERHNVHVSCQGTRILIRKTLDDALLSDPATMARFWHLSRILFRRLERNLRERFGPGRADWIRIQGGTGEAVPSCLVCGEAIYFNRIHCARCDTAHHLDCWEYVGHCAVYACDCTDFRYSRTGAAKG